MTPICDSIAATGKQNFGFPVETECSTDCVKVEKALFHLTSSANHPRTLKQIIGLNSRYNESKMRTIFKRLDEPQRLDTSIDFIVCL